jgi:hypothetical protein
MLHQRVIQNKFYKYGKSFIKIKRINKTQNRIFAVDIRSDEDIILPIEGSELILFRIYSIGEVAKLVGRQPNTLRKYEKKNLIASPKKFGDEYPSYKNWRYYDESDVYEMIEFFNARVQGRPKKRSIKNLGNNIVLINQKIKLHR